MNEDRELLRQFQIAESEKVKIALATIVRVTGSSYRKVGAKMLITETGDISGMISGGCLERDVIRRALMAMRTRDGQVVRYDSRIDFLGASEEVEAAVETPSLGCEGLIEIFINPSPKEHLQTLHEVHLEFKDKEFTLNLPDGSIFIDQLRPPVRLIIFGGGPDAVSMARLGRELGWHTTMLDCRSSFPLSQKRHNWIADHYQVCAPGELRLHIPASPEFVAIAMTHNYDHDRSILQILNEVRPLYAGVLGPRSRTLRMIDDLANTGVLIDSSRFHFPMGLDIGGDTPQAVALSALAEAQAVLSNRQGGFLKFRLGSIHAESELKSRRQRSSGISTE